MLRYSADRRSLTLVGLWFALEAFVWTRPLAFSLETLGVVILLCMGSFLGAVATHNAIHCPVFVARQAENVYRCVLTLIYGHPVSAFVPVHNMSHHRHLDTSRDVMRTSKVFSKWNLLNLLFFTAKIGGDLWRAEFSYLRFAWRRRPRWAKRLLVETVVLVVAVAALAVLDWQKLLVFVIVPHMYAAWGIVTMNLLQHDGADVRTWQNQSRSFVGPIINYFTFNNGYHAVHHLKPTLHWSLAPAAHARLVQPFTDPELDQKSLVGYVFKTYVYPGRRRRFDGAPIPLVDPGPDERWYELPSDVRSSASAAVG